MSSPIARPLAGGLRAATVAPRTSAPASQVMDASIKLQATRPLTNARVLARLRTPRAVGVERHVYVRVAVPCKRPLLPATTGKARFSRIPRAARDPRPHSVLLRPWLGHRDEYLRRAAASITANNAVARIATSHSRSERPAYRR
jgi:hypothetical protein